LERAIAEEKRKAREEIDEFKANLEIDYKNRIDELNGRIGTLQDEKRRLKNELNPLKQRIRELETEIQSLKQKLEDKEMQIGLGEKQRQELMEEINSKRRELEILNEKLKSANGLNEQYTKTIAALEQSARELKQQRDEQR